MDPAWTFHRNGQQLTMQRREVDQGYELELTGPGDPRAYRFDQMTALVKFQSDMEQFLIKTGWSLEEFSPDRRTGQDRRTFPRVDLDRRRWWTDGLRLFQMSISSRRRQKPRRAEK